MIVIGQSPKLWECPPQTPPFLPDLISKKQQQKTKQKQQQNRNKNKTKQKRNNAFVKCS